MAQALMELSVETDPGVFNKNANDNVILRSASLILHELLNKANMPLGRYHLQTYRKMRWHGYHAVPYKIGIHQHGCVYITIKPPGSGNETAYEYKLGGKFNGWDAARTHELLLAHIHQELHPDNSLREHDPEPELTLPETPAVPAPTVPVTEIPTLKISERVAKLEATASRNNRREEQLAKLRSLRAEHQRQIIELQDKISGIENQELQTLEEMEADTECLAAIEALNTLRSLLQ